jgi:hypothetical protein
MEFKTKWRLNLEIWKASAWPCCKECRGGRTGWGRFGRPYPEALMVK